MSKWKCNLFLFTERVLSRYTSKIICISEAERISAIHHQIASDDELEVILNGIDFTAIEQAKTKRRSDLGIPKDAFIIGMVGRISEQKAPDIFIQAAKLIKESIPNVFFMIVGDGEGRAGIEAYAEKHNLDLYISGWTSTPYAYIKMFDMAMLLSRWEGFGLAIVEYMAARKNFVATKVDAIPTIVRDGVDCILVDVDSSEQAAKAVIRLYNDKVLAGQMIEQAWNYAHQRYDINRVAEQHIELFNKLLSQ